MFYAKDTLIKVKDTVTVYFANLIFKEPKASNVAERLKASECG